MSVKRNWFVYLSYIIYLAASLLILSFGMEQWKETKELEHAYLVNTVLIISFVLFYVIINIIFFLITRPILLKLGSHLGKIKYIFEVLSILAILAGGIILRIHFIQDYPIAMESDYKFYYDVAVMIKDGTLTTLSNNEYISLFPHTYGYSFLLSLAMRIFGMNPDICYYMNIAFSALTALFCYGIGRRIAGGVAGISAMVLSFFWPSQIIFSNVNGAEAAFTCLLYGAAFLAVLTMQISFDTRLGIGKLVLIHLFSGICIAVSSAIRPMGLVLLIAYIVCLLSINRRLKHENIIEIPLKKIFLSKGLFRVVFVVFGYFLTSQLIGAWVSQSIEMNIASGGAMGYSLMVGTNIASDGGYSEDTMNYLYNVYQETESANASNDACMDRAIEQIKEDPLGILELMAKKFYLVWSNDDYATTTNLVTMNNQGLLTEDIKDLFGFLAGINNIYYLFIILLSSVGIIFLFKKDNAASLFAIFFIGTIALLLLVEMQNRYHYFALQSLSIIAAGGIGFTYEHYKQLSLERIKNKLTTKSVAEAAVTAIDEKSIPETVAEASESFSTNLNTIDVIKAIQDGHIAITATKAYADDALASNQGYETVVEEPVVEEPVVEDPVVEDPVVEEPVVEEPVVEEPVVEDPVVEDPVVEDPVVEEPVVEEPVVEDPVVEDPVVEDPVVEELVVEELVVEEPVVEEPVVEEQVLDEKVLDEERILEVNIYQQEETKADSSVIDLNKEKERPHVKKVVNGSLRTNQVSTNKSNSLRHKKNKRRKTYIEVGKIAYIMDRLLDKPKPKESRRTSVNKKKKKGIFDNKPMDKVRKI